MLADAKILITNPAFVVLWTAMFASTAGATLMLVALSVALLQSTGSALSIGLVYAAQFLPLPLLMPLAERLCDRVAPRRLLVAVELASLVTTLAIGLVFEVSYWIVFALLIARGFFEMTMKSARGVAIKLYLSDEILEQGNTLLANANYLGGAVGGLIGAVLIGRSSMLEIAMVDAATFLLSASLYAALQSRPPPNGSAARPTGLVKRTLLALRRDHHLARAMLYLVGTAILFHGFNHILRVWLPLKWLGLPASAAASFETIGVAGVIVGTVVVASLVSGKRRSGLPTLAFVGLNTAVIATLIASKDPFSAAFAYFAYTATYEIVFLKVLNDIMLRAEPAEVPPLMVSYYGTVFAGMTLAALAVGSITDHFGLPAAVFGVVIATTLVAAAAEYAAIKGSRVADAASLRQRGRR